MTTKHRTSYSIGDITFNRLQRLYWLALTLVALSAIGSQLLIQYHLKKQLGDAKVINIAGRQRMLSQKLAKEVLLLTNEKFYAVENRENLKKTLQQWTLAHEGLQSGNDSLELTGRNSLAVQQLFDEINPYYHNLRNLTQYILRKDSVITDKNKFRQEFLNNENRFLYIMDGVVFTYEKEAKNRVSTLRLIEFILFIILIGLLVLELFFIFKPAAKKTKQIVQELSSSENEAKKIAEENKILAKDKEKSLKTLQTLNFALDNAALYANLTLDGKLLYMSQKFKSLLKIKDFTYQIAFAKVITSDEGEQQYLNDFINIPRSSIFTEEISITTSSQEKIWLEITIIPVNQEGIQQNLLLLCNDLTLRKQAQLEIERLNKERFELEITQQRNRSIQIVKAQDNERKRIAKDMHDGIGQMLTALKFNLESINLAKPEKATKKLNDIKLLAGDIIKQVRVATFNLTPPELGDYGISTGIARLVEGLRTRTGKNILFENRSNFDARLESHIEINLYRITQEAINNAIKYAESNYILVTLCHNDSLLSIVIDDDGLGFDITEFQSANTLKEDGSGMGLSFMQERINFINGRLFFHSSKNEGTRITINIPLKNKQ